MVTTFHILQLFTRKYQFRRISGIIKTLRNNNSFENIGVCIKILEDVLIFLNNRLVKKCSNIVHIEHGHKLR